MMMTEQNVLEMLSKSEAHVYTYIKEESQKHGGAIKESMKQIGERLGSSEATVHRAISKLRKQGIIGIVPSMDKAESNEIVYYGIPDPKQQVGDIFKMISELNSSKNRFEAILESKDQQLEQQAREKELLYTRIGELEEKLKALQQFDKGEVISSRDLGNGTTAYIIKNN
ncbi:winged helix-turn-helix transcriptional regulator [Bacillus sp. ILBB4]|nr:winged helix-turn-helix transcriptional regulator [Bacillus sp. ILBB4]